MPITTDTPLHTGALRAWLKAAGPEAKRATALGESRRPDGSPVA
jgi:hypothetical protein